MRPVLILFNLLLGEQLSDNMKSFEIGHSEYLVCWWLYDFQEQVTIQPERKYISTGKTHGDLNPCFKISWAHAFKLLWTSSELDRSSRVSCPMARSGLSLWWQIVYMYIPCPLTCRLDTAIVHGRREALLSGGKQIWYNVSFIWSA